MAAKLSPISTDVCVPDSYRRFSINSELSNISVYIVQYIYNIYHTSLYNDHIISIVNASFSSLGISKTKYTVSFRQDNKNSIRNLRINASQFEYAYFMLLTSTVYNRSIHYTVQTLHTLHSKYGEWNVIYFVISIC